MTNPYAHLIDPDGIPRTSRVPTAGDMRTYSPDWDDAPAQPPAAEKPKRKKKSGKSLAVPQDRPNEGTDDPHRLATAYLRMQATNSRGERTLICHRDDFHEHDGIRYLTVPYAEIKARLTTFIKSQFDAENMHLQQHPELWDSTELPRCRRVTTGTVNNTMAALESLTLVPNSVDAPAWLRGEHWGKPEDILPTRSGLLHLPRALLDDDCLHPSTARFYTTSGVDYAFDGVAGCSEWIKFLLSLWPDDPQSIALLQEWIGYLLSLDGRHHKILMLIGPPRSGKGTISRIIKLLLGMGSVASPTLGSLAGPFGLWPLLGKSVAIVADARLSGRTDAIAVVERLLSISGGDPQDVHRKNMPTLAAIKMAVRFMLMSNELPNLRDSSGALTSRILLLRTLQSFLGQEDKGLDDRLAEELPGILNWSILGWHRLRERGAFVQPDSARDLLADLDDLASPISQFIRECCNVAPEQTTATEAAFRAWKAWCEQHGINHPGTNETFGKDLRSALPQISKSQHRTENGRYWAYNGVGLKLSDTSWH